MGNVKMTKRNKKVFVDTDTENFLEAVKLCAKYIGNEALAKGCFNVYHMCTLLEQSTEEEQIYVPYSTDS